MDRHLKQLWIGFCFIHSHNSDTVAYIKTQRKDIKQNKMLLIEFSIASVLLN